MSSTPFGFRILGACTEVRRVIDWATAFSAYAACDPRAKPECESYLSAFAFGSDFRQHLESNGSTRGFSGSCGSAWIWFDVDRESDLECALIDTRRLAAGLVERFDITEDELLIFYSGSKGFHLGLPTALWQPVPAVAFNVVARRFAEQIAGLARVAIDLGVYDKVRAFRAPNSRHPKTSLHKRRFLFDELNGFSLDRILELSKNPEPFELPAPRARSEAAAGAWQDAIRLVEIEAQARAQRRLAGNGSPTLNRLTLDFIRNGADAGDRHRLLFSAAANLAEFTCPPALAHALLSDAALDSGLPPKEVCRQIECGLEHAASGGQA